MGRNLDFNPDKVLTLEDLPSGAATDAEFIAADAAHLAAIDPHLQYATQARGDERYFRGRTQAYTLDPPAVAAGSEYRIFLPFIGAKLGDFCSIVPISVNIITANIWYFRFTGVVISDDNIGCYLMNHAPVTIDLGPFQIRAMVINT
jgi:hypothetical protein